VKLCNQSDEERTSFFARFAAAAFNNGFESTAFLFPGICGSVGDMFRCARLTTVLEEDLVINMFSVLQSKKRGFKNEGR